MTHKILAFTLLFAGFALAGDKPAATPQTTDAQKFELVRAERDALNARLQALPVLIAAQEAQQRAFEVSAKVLKELGLDAAQWEIDPATYEPRKRQVEQKKP